MPSRVALTEFDIQREANSTSEGASIRGVRSRSGIVSEVETPVQTSHAHSSSALLLLQDVKFAGTNAPTRLMIRVSPDPWT